MSCGGGRFHDLNEVNRGCCVAHWLSSLALVIALCGVAPAVLAQTEGYDCVSETSEDLLCLSLPSGTTEVEDQARRNLKVQSQETVRGPAPKISMVTEGDLTGAALIETEFERQVASEPEVTSEGQASASTLAELEAYRVNKQVHDLYIFLDLTGRTGGSGDTTVISAGRK